MCDEKTNSSRVLGQEQRYNPCMDCGGELRIEVDGYNEYGLRCVSCGTCIGVDIVPIPGQDPVEVCRHQYNKNVLEEMYTNASLARLGLENGDYIVTEVSDDFIVYVGNGRGMIDFLRGAKSTCDYRFNIYRLMGHCFELVGLYIRQH